VTGPVTMSGSPELPRRARPSGVDGLPDTDRCLVMGVVNVTPDSFSDGGRWFDTDTAVRHGLDLLAAGADLLDVGGESTRPGAVRVPLDEELRRVIPVVRELCAAGAVVSVDTMRAAVAARAVEAGARILNDVSGGRADPDMFTVAADTAVPFILMHWRRHADSMQSAATYTDVVAEVLAELEPQVERALATGVAADRLVLDPGLGFSKTGEHNWTLLRRLDELVALGRPVLVAASRKRFLGELLAGDDGLRPPGGRDAATAAITALSAARGAWCVRVHDVAPSADAVRVQARWDRG
jgi:dihydropteroate synthase